MSDYWVRNKERPKYFVSWLVGPKNLRTARQILPLLEKYSDAYATWGSDIFSTFDYCLAKDIDNWIKDGK